MNQWVTRPGWEQVSVTACHLRQPQVGEFGGDNRAGIDKTLHRISCIRNRAGRVVGLTCRVGRAIAGGRARLSLGQAVGSVMSTS